MLLLLLIFFTLIGSANAVSDVNNDFQNNYTSIGISEISPVADISDDISNDISGGMYSDGSSVGFRDVYIDDLDDNSCSEKNKNMVSANDDSYNAGNPVVTDNNSDGSNTDGSSDNLNSVDSSNILPQYIKVNDSKFYSSNSLIQKIIDGANPGSTIEFTGSFYKDLHLKIDKPLNIISKCGTVINMTYDLPVFAILKGGSGTNISGFKVNAAGSFVEASDVSHINIMKNKISTKKTVLLFTNVIDSNIQNNLFSSFKTAIDIRKSKGISISKNNITPDTGYNVGINLEDCDGSPGVGIYDNLIKGIKINSFSTGISVGENVKNLKMRGNIITDWRTGVHFLDSIVNFEIYNNTISHNGDGLVLDKGIMEHLNFTKNVISENANVGFLFEDDFEGTKDNPVFENNIFSKNTGMAVQSKGVHGFDIGRNFLNGNKLCVKIKMKKLFSIKFRKNGNQIIASVLGGNGGAKDLPDFKATLNIDGKDYDIIFRNGIGYAKLNSPGEGSDSGFSDSSFTIGDVTKTLTEWGTVHEVSSDEINPYIQEYLDNFKTHVNPTDDDGYDDSDKNSTYNHKSHRGSGSGDSGLTNGSSSISSSSNPLSAASSSAGASSSASSGSSPSSSEPADSASVKTLSVDEETFRVVGVGGLVFLIILVIGLYYREDIQEMMKDEK